MVRKVSDSGVVYYEPPYDTEEERALYRRTVPLTIVDNNATEPAAPKPETIHFRVPHEQPPHPNAHARDVIMCMVFEMAESFVPEGEWLNAETEHRMGHIHRMLNKALGLPPDDPVETPPPGFLWTPPPFRKD